MEGLTSLQLLSYYNGQSYTFTWEKGKQLASAVTGGKTLSFEYNADGIRTEKTVSGEYTYTYRLDGDKVVEMVKDGVGVHNRYVFIYDNDGNPHAMYYYYDGATTPTKYYYVLNVQGDVVQLRNSSNAVIANYTYDAWGKLLSVTSSSGTVITSSTHIANINPIRYRGYFYDTETKLYYCNSRYYDPQVRRFINADTEDALQATPGEFTDKNLFAYCDNNPVMRGDNVGELWHVVAGAAIGGIISGVKSIVDSRKNGDTLGKTIAKAMMATTVGAIGGAVAASGVYVMGQVAVGALLGASQELFNQGVDGNGFNAVNVAKSTLSGMVGGFVGGAGASFGNKYMAGHASRFLNHVISDGLCKSGRYLWKMTANYSKQFILGAILGVAKATAGAHFTSAISSSFINAIESRRNPY